MSDTLTLHEWLAKISRQLDILTLVMLDVRRDLNGQPAVMDLPDPDQIPQAASKPPPSLGEAKIMVSGDRTFVRQPLPGKNFLVGVIEDGQFTSLQIETPSGDRTDVTAQEVEDAFGLKLTQTINTTLPSSHPTDRALNPDVEIADGR